MPVSVCAEVGDLMTSTWLNSVAGSVVKSGCCESIWSGEMKTSPFNNVPTCGKPRTLTEVPTPASRLICTPVTRCRASVIVVSGSWPMLSAEMLSWMLGASRFTWMARICDWRTPVTMTSSSASAGLASAAASAADALAAAAAASSTMDTATERGWLRCRCDTVLALLRLMVSSANRFYLFGLLTNQTIMAAPMVQAPVASGDNPAMIVRRGYESNDDACTAPSRYERNAAAVAAECF